MRTVLLRTVPVAVLAAFAIQASSSAQQATGRALKIEDYKNFLRLHIDPDGVLTIYPIKIERVPRDWRSEGDHFRPSGGTPPELIEDAPVVVR